MAEFIVGATEIFLWIYAGLHEQDLGVFIIICVAAGLLRGIQQHRLKRGYY